MHLFAMCFVDDHFTDIIQFFYTTKTCKGYTTQQNKELVVWVIDFSVSVGNLYKMGSNKILCRYVLEYE